MGVVLKNKASVSVGKCSASYQSSCDLCCKVHLIKAKTLEEIISMAERMDASIASCECKKKSSK